MLGAGSQVRILLLTSDAALVSTFSDLSDQLGIDARASAAPQEARMELDRAKYEGVVLDYDTIADAGPVLTSMRQSPSNRNSVVFAVATEPAAAVNALAERAHFLLRRPVDVASLKSILSVAYDLMQSERRRYFRFAARVPVQLTTDGGMRYDCFSINISSSGIALECPESLRLADLVDLTILLEPGTAVHASGSVIWDDKHGKCGVHFHCSNPQMRAALDSWLDARATAQQGPLQ